MEDILCGIESKLNMATKPGQTLTRHGPSSSDRKPTSRSTREILQPESSATEETYDALLFRRTKHAEDLPVTVTVIPSIRDNLINQQIVENLSLYSTIFEAKLEDPRRYVLDREYHSTTWVKIRWHVPEYMKHREDTFHVVQDLPYDMLVSTILHAETDRKILSETRPEETEQQVLPTYTRWRPKSEHRFVLLALCSYL
jgi:hypothetical protein